MKLPNFYKKIIREVFIEDFEKMQYELIESLKLKDMSDDELIKKFEHTKWKEVNKFEKCYLKSRYGFIESHFKLELMAYAVCDDDYISDSIKEILAYDLAYNSSLKKLADIKIQKTTKRSTKETKRK